MEIAGLDQDWGCKDYSWTTGNALLGRISEILEPAFMVDASRVFFIDFSEISCNNRSHGPR